MSAGNAFDDDAHTPDETEMPSSDDSGIRTVSERDLRRLLRAQEVKHAQTKKAEKQITAARVFLGAVAGAIIMTVGATVSTLAFGQTKIDAGVAPVKSELAEHKIEERRAMAEHKVEEKEARAASNERLSRLELKVDALLLRFGVPNPAPTPVDAGK